jgi:hypothetical protein
MAWSRVACWWIMAARVLEWPIRAITSLTVAPLCAHQVCRRAGWDGIVLEFRKPNDYRANAHPATICIRGGAAVGSRRLDGVAGLRRHRALIAANAVSTGYLSADAGLLYRKFPAHATNQPAPHRDR